MFGLPPIVTYAIVAAALVASLWGAAAWHAGVHYQRGYDKAATEAMEANKERLEREVHQNAKASKGRETDRVRIETVYEEIEVEVERVVERAVYLDRCFDDDGLRLANAALRGEGAAGRGADGTMPGAEALGLGLGQGGAEQAGGSVPALSRLPESAPPAR